MNKHRVEFAAPAERAYDNLRLSAGASRSRECLQLLQQIDELIDEKIAISPFQSGRKLYGAIGDLSLEGLYWISQETLHLFYELSSHKPLTIVVDYIWTEGPNTEADIRRVDLMFAQMLLSGELIAVPGVRLSAMN